MPLRIDHVDSRIEVMRKPAGSAGTTGGSESSAAPGAGGGSETLSAVRGRSALREMLRPIVMEILDDELQRMKRKVGSP